MSLPGGAETIDYVCHSVGCEFKIFTRREGKTFSPLNHSAAEEARCREHQRAAVLSRRHLYRGRVSRTVVALPSEALGIASAENATEALTTTWTFIAGERDALIVGHIWSGRGRSGKS